MITHICQYFDIKLAILIFAKSTLVPFDAFIGTFQNYLMQIVPYYH